MYSLIVILTIIVAILLIFIVLIQESKGGGLASNFSASNAIMGVRKTTDFLEKSTWTLAALLVILSIISVYAKPQAETPTSIVTSMPSAPISPVLPGQQPVKAPVAPSK